MKVFVITQQPDAQLKEYVHVQSRVFVECKNDTMPLEGLMMESTYHQMVGEDRYRKDIRGTRTRVTLKTLTSHYDYMIQTIYDTYEEFVEANFEKLI